MSATLVQPADEITAKRASTVARARLLGWSQNELARRARRNPGTVSRLLSGKIVSAPLWGQIERALLREEKRRSRRRRAA